MALAAQHSKRAAPAMRKALTDPDREIRIAAAEYFRVQRDPAAVPRLIDLLDDADGMVRVTAAGALGASHDRRAVEPLLVRLRCGSVDALLVAVPLAELGDVRAVAALDSLLACGNVAVRRTSVIAMTALRHEASSRAHERARSDADPSVAVLVAFGLARRGDRAAVRRLFELLSDPAVPPDTRREAAEGIGLLGQRTAKAELERHAADPELRLSILYALAELGQASAVGDLRQAISNPADRGEAHRHLERICRRVRTLP
jgi:HEAT repeat protein